MVGLRSRRKQNNTKHNLQKTNHRESKHNTNETKTQTSEQDYLNTIKNKKQQQQSKQNSTDAQSYDAPSLTPKSHNGPRLGAEKSKPIRIMPH